jgi:hypothetical protein
MLAATVIVAIGLLRLISTDYYSNDAAQYWSTINNLLQGRGVRTSAVYYEVQAATGMPALQTVWPPGLPLLAAFVSGVTGLGAERAVGVLNIGAHVLSSLLIYWMVARLRGSRGVALVLGLAHLLYPPILGHALAGVSEPLSLLATVAAAAAVTKAFEAGDDADARWLAAAAVAIGAGCWIRYQVVFQVVPLGLVCLATWWRRETRVGLAVRTAFVLSPAVLAFGALLVRNWIISGTATGANTAARGNTVAELAFQAKWALLSFLGGGAGLFDRVAIIILAASGSACLWLAWRHGAAWQVRASALNAVVGAYALVGAALTTLIIVAMATRSTFYTLEGRYFHGALVLAALGLVAIWPRRLWWHQSNAARLAARGAAAAGVALLALQLVGWAGYLRRGGETVTIRRALETPYLNRTVGDALRDRGSFASPIMSNQSQLLHLVLGVPTFGVPERRLTRNVWKPDEIVAAARKFGVEHIVIFKKMPLGSTDGSTDYVWQMGGTPPADLVRALENDVIALYRIAGK